MYYDQRWVTVPWKELTYETLRNAILHTFEVTGITIMYGDKFMETQQDLDELLGLNQQEYQLLLYDAA